MISVIYTILCLISFIVGFAIGERTGAAKPIQLNPVKVAEDAKVKKETKIAQEETIDYLDNIDNYPYNQKKFN